ncbi:hypothetical protein N658DRAFT_198032 [Parathielavia hyrcaniae]|uniref:Serine/threonine-protein kinase BSK1-like TPR repeats domain-containing protein n=1 Tax=Parathielavia hyrcaniae TaxID=113614 RepID=A0AAN6Q7J7_9PEZI|nr:hypothetical protein N658DRAFT_198032 [Parathielavia hyrcaniae]
MATPEEQAIEFKNQGNKAFAAHDWPAAIDFYTKAIELNDKEPTFWSNRAQAYLKTEAYGFAIRDATKAVELKPGFVKVRLVPQSSTTSQTFRLRARLTTPTGSRPTTGERRHMRPS